MDNGNSALGEVGSSTTADVSGNSISTVFTFMVENLLYTAALTATCWFVSHYFPMLRIPALVFMFVDTVSVMACTHAVSSVFILSLHRKSAKGVFSNSTLSETSQGFAVVTSLLWLGVLWCLFLDVPKITSVPGFPVSSSAIALAVVLGVSVVIPVLTLVTTYASVPAGYENSLVFNGSTIGAVCLLFLVIISFGSGGVTKCHPHVGPVVTTLFYVLVLSYWLALLILEIVIFAGFSPLHSILHWTGNKSNGQNTAIERFRDAWFSWCEITLWRIVGCLLNVAIILSSFMFTDSAVHNTIWIVALIVVILHIPLVFSIKLNRSDSYQDDQESVPTAHPIPQQPQAFMPPQFQAQAANSDSVMASTFPFNNTRRDGTHGTQPLNLQPHP